MPVDLWTSPAFLDRATAWTAERGGEIGMRLTGEWDQPHARPWSSAIRFETDAGRLWFKVNGPGTAHEGGLLTVLARVVPDLVPRLVAVDTAQGWTLMHDAGPVLRTVAEPDQLWERWSEILCAYGVAQLGLRPHVDEMVDAGVENLGPELLPGRLRELVEELSAQPVDRGGLEADEAERLLAVAPEYDAWCAELAACGIGVTINHDDLHSANVCVGPDGTRVIDWGDASVMHPFGTMLATLNSVAWHAKTEVDDPRVERLRDSYLDVFAAHGSRAERVRWVELARRTGCVSRALSYARAFEGEPVESQADADWPVRGWLLELLEV
jgi:hypothetical protein